MENNYSIGDFVIYESKLYTVAKIYAPNWGIIDPFVYGLTLVPSDPKDPLEGKLLLIRGSLLVKAKDKDIKTWEILYGRKLKD